MDIADLADPPERPRKTAPQKLHEDMQRQLAPICQMQGMQDLLKRLSPRYEIQELMRQLEPPRQVLEMLGRSSIPKHIQEIIDGTYTAAQAQRMMDQYLPKNTASLGLDNEALRKAAGLDSVGEIAKRYEQYLKPIKEQQDILERVQRQGLGGVTAKKMARYLEQVDPAFRAMESAKKALDSLWPSVRGIDFSAFAAHEEEQQEAARAVQDITQAAVAEPTLKEAVDQIVGAIEAQQHPAVKVLLWIYFKKVLDILINAAVGGVLSVYISAAMAPSVSPQAEHKAVKEVARHAVGAPELLMEYRYVSAKLLIVHQNPRARSPEVGRLIFGKPVKLVKREKDFALVVWTDKESGAEIQGWVFARYLEKFN